MAPGPPPHFVQASPGPVFLGTGAGDLSCQCGQSVLIKGYRPEYFLAIRIKCFRCGAVTTTPGLPDGDVLPIDAVAVDVIEQPVVTPNPTPPYAVIACKQAIADVFAATQPNSPTTEPMQLCSSVLESAAENYDRLTGGLLAEHTAASKGDLSSDVGDYPFAWALLRLREQITKPDWAWARHNDDAMASMYVGAFQQFLYCWGQHPALSRIAAPLAQPGVFPQVMATAEVARILFASGNRVGFLFSTANTGVRFATSDGDALAIEMRSPEQLQWPFWTQWTPQTTYSAIVEALFGSRGQLNLRRQGLLILSATILQPGFDQALVDAINAVLGAASRRHRGVAAIAGLVPHVYPEQRLDRVRFGYSFYPIRNERFVGENPVRVGAKQDFVPQPPAISALRQ